MQAPHVRRVLGDRVLRGRVLNAGCGEGLYAPLVEGFGTVRSIVNMDMSQPSIARRRPDPRNHDAQGSLASLPFLAGAFEVVICTEVLEHVPDDRTAVLELARVLTPSGLLLLSVPTPPAPFDPAHAREGYALAQLRPLLESAGFDVIASATCFHLLMRALYRGWHLQQRLAARNVLPRFVLRAIAHADRALPLGRPWDLVVACTRTGPNPSAPASV